MEGDVWHVVVSPLRRWNTFKRGVGERMTPEPKTQENDEFTFPFTNITIPKALLKALMTKDETISAFTHVKLSKDFVKALLKKGIKELLDDTPTLAKGGHDPTDHEFKDPRIHEPSGTLLSKDEQEELLEALKEFLGTKD